METSWEDLSVDLLDPIKDTIEDLSFESMTPVQAACIPLLLGYKDVAAEAVTGSGKTLAFLIPVIQIILKKKNDLKKHDIGALIVSPTRELATQIHEVLQTFLKHCPNLTSMLTVGGTNVLEDLNKYHKNGCHIVVGTPGRVEDLLGRKIPDRAFLSAGVKALEILILDEADKLLDLGFTGTLNTIFAYLPKQRRTGLFSATQTSDVINLIRAGLRNPVQVRVKEKDSTGEERTPSKLNNYYMVCEYDKKFSTLVKFLKDNKSKKVMIFFSTCACVNYFATVLKDILKDTKILSLHGKMKEKRFKVFDNFRNLESGILACTDVMCRGVDIPLVDWVLQYDAPSSASSFVHRCGRTARAGEEGSALVFLLPNETDYVEFIRLNQKVVLNPKGPLTDVEDCTKLMHKSQIKDRSVMDKANCAFVSYIQSYVKHECNVLLNVKHLDMGLLATGFGLLKLPKMPELKTIKMINFKKYEIDFNTIAYKDKQKEKIRLQKLDEYKKTGKWPGMKLHIPKVEAWSRQKDQKEKKLKRKEKRIERKRKNKFTQEELDDLSDDVRMLKKLKKGKISSDDFDKHFGCEGSDDDSTEKETPKVQPKVGTQS